MRRPTTYGPQGRSPAAVDLRGTAPDNAQPVARDVPAARTLLRGLRLLELIAAGCDGSVTQLAAAAELDKGTTSRLLSTLREAGYLRRDRVDRRYRLSGKVLRLASAYSDQLDLRGVARPHLALLRDAVEETVHLGVMEDDRIIYIDKLDSSRSIRMVSAIGHTEPAYTTALGRAILSRLPVVERTRLVQGFDLTLRTTRTVASPGDLLKVLEECERRGYTVDDEENQEHVTCVGAAIVDALGAPVAALSCSGPSYRMAGRIAEIGDLTRQCATAISGELGGRT